MALGHISAPGNHRICVLYIIIVTGRFIDAESLDKTDHCRCHTVTRIRVDIITAETGLHQLGHGITFRDGVLARTEYSDAVRPHVVIGFLELFFHLIECLFPGHRMELAVFSEFTVFHTHQRLGQTVFTVQDLTVEVTLDTVQATVNRGIRVAFGSNDLAIFGCNHDTATGTTESTDTFVPLPASFTFFTCCQSSRAN